MISAAHGLEYVFMLHALDIMFHPTRLNDNGNNGMFQRKGMIQRTVMSPGFGSGEPKRIRC